MAAPVIQFKRGLFSNLPGLRAGEPGFTTDKYDLYVGVNSTSEGNKFFGSHRYWTKETSTTGSGVNLVEGTNNGENAITLKAPASLNSSYTITFPGAIVNNGYLKVKSDGTLSWDNEVQAENINVIGIASITQLLATTANVGAGLTVSGDTDLNGNLDVDGFTELDAVNISETLSVAGVSTFTGNIDANGNLDVDGFTELDAVNISETLNVTGVSTFTGNIDANGNLDVDGFAELDAVNISETLSVTGVSTFTGNIDANGNLDVAGGIAGNFNATGVSTAAFLQATTVNASGIVTASSFSGSGSGLSSGTVPISSLDIDGGTAASALTADDLFIIDDGAGGTNKKLTAQQLSDYVLGGSGGATFPAINVTGIGTIAQLQATTATVGAGLTVSGDADLNGNLDVDGFTELDAVNISETLSVTGVSTFTGNIVANGNVDANGDLDVDGFTELDAVNISETLSVTGISTFTGAIDANGGANISGSATIDQLSVTGVVTASSFVGEGSNVTNLTYGNIVGVQTAVRSEFSATSSDFGRLTYNSSTGEFSVAGITTSEIRNQFSAGTGVSITSGQVSIGQPVATTDSVTFNHIRSTGIVTATSFATGASGSAIVVNSDTITGPSSITIDPAGVGDATGTVYILGDLQVKGTQTVIESTTVTVEDLNITLANGAVNDAAADGGGITVQSGDGNKTLQFQATGDNFGSSENLNLASGKVYKINNVEVLSATGLSTNVTVNAVSLDIDGATAATALTSDDLFLIDDGASGNNKKLTAQQLSNYVLGGSGGATFPAINVTGIATINQLLPNTVSVGAGLTVSGDTDLNGNLDVDGFTELDAVNISETLSVTGVSTFTGNIDANGNLDVAGGITGNFNATGVSTSAFLQATTVNASGIVTASSFVGNDIRKSDGALIPLVGVSTASAFTGLVTAFKFVGTGLEDFSVVNGVAEVSYSGVAASTYTTSNTFTATQGQTSFLFTPGYIDGFVDVYLNGIRLITGVDFTANDGANVVLSSGATAGDELEVVSFKELGDLIYVQNLKVVDNLTAGIVTATGSFNGNLNATGVSTAGFLQVTTVNASGIVTASGFVGGLTGNADTATALDNARDFQITGDAASAAVSFDGTTNVGLAVTLATVNSNVGQYGSQTTIPVITVNAKGLVTAVTTASVGTALTVTGDSGSETIDLLSESLAITGGTNLTSSASSNGVTINLDNNISLTSVVASGIITATSGFSGNLTGNVTGNVTGDVSGNLNSVGVSTISFLKATTATLGAGLTVTGATDLNGGLDVSGGETVLSSATVSDLTSGRVVLAGASGALVDSGNLTFGANGLVVTGGANVSAASTFGSDLAVGGNVVVSGDLTVNGTTTQINTVQMTVEDTLIELQMVDGSAPSSDTNKDVGVVMNYFDSSAKKAAFYWDDSAGRMVAASQVSESSGVLTASTFAGLEIGSLYVNDCAGASQVISCSGTTRSLENITIDGGSF